MQRQLPSRRGLTLIELMLALTISTMVAAAVAGMLHAVSTGVGTRRDNRAVMVLAHAAQSRLSSYIGPSRCLLWASGGDAVLWLDDARASGRVHASEVRWLRFDAEMQTLSVHYVQFPPEWSEVTCDLADGEYGADSDWNAIREDYASKGLIAVRPILDQVDGVSLSIDAAQAQDAQVVHWNIGFNTESGPVVVMAGGAIRVHQPPKA